MGKGKPPNLEGMRKLKDWLDTPKDKRVPKTMTKFAESMGLSAITINVWKKKILNGKLEKQEPDQKEYIEQVKRHAFDKGNPKALELYGTLMDYIGKDKKANQLEELTADDYYRVRKEAKLRLESLSGESRTAGDVGAERGILSKDVLISPEPEQGRDSEVAAVAVPAGLTFDI